MVIDMNPHPRRLNSMYPVILRALRKIRGDICNTSPNFVRGIPYSVITPDTNDVCCALVGSVT